MLTNFVPGGNKNNIDVDRIGSHPGVWFKVKTVPYRYIYSPLPIIYPPAIYNLNSPHL